MTRASLRLIIPAVLLVACSERPTAPDPNILSSPDATASADKGGKSAPDLASVLWEARASDVVKARSFSPIVGVRAYALVAVAQYAAVVAADGRRGGDDHEGSKGFHASADVRRGAVAGASVQVLSYLAPTLAAGLETLLSGDAAALTGAAHDAFVQGVAIGRSSGDAIIVVGKADGFANADGTAKVWDPSTLPAGPDIWFMDADATPHVPAGFQFPTMKPYFLKSPGQFRAGPPPTDIGPAAQEVVDIVNARTAEQAAIAVFWNLAPPSITPLGYWDQQAAMYIKEHRLDERDATHVFALVNAAAMDAVTGCWETKFHYLVRRPWQVRPLDLTNAKLIIGRPNHPSYTSGHSCVSSAAATVLKHFFPEAKKTLDAQVAEAGMSRIYAGIHYRFDIDAGRALGRSTARWALRYDHKHGLLAAVLPGGSHHDHDNRP